MNLLSKTNQQSTVGMGSVSTSSVWIYVSNVTDDENVVEDILDLLDEDELCRARSFKFQTDRNAYIVAHGLLRSVLSLHFPIAPKDWNFRKSALGKPEQINFPDEMHFNISHTRGVVCCALSHHPIGIDIESIRAFDLFPVSILPMSSKEINDINQLSSWRTAVCWTLRESLLKSTGEGISGISKDLQFRLDEGKIRLKSNFSSYLEQWQFVSYSINDTYIVSTSINPACIVPVVNINAPKSKLIGASMSITTTH